MIKFRSPTEKPVHLSLTSGHTMVVGPEPTDVPDRFKRAAIDAGCLLPGEEPEAPPERTRHQVIVDAIQAMVDAGSEENFNADGTPDLSRLKKKLGWAVTREERDAAWRVVKGDDGDDDPEEV